MAVSTSSQSIAERLLRLVGRPDLVDQPWFASGRTRAEHADELDAAVGSWITARTRAEVVSEFERAEAAVAPIYTAEDIVADPQLQAIGTIRRMRRRRARADWPMQGPLFRMSATPPGSGTPAGRRRPTPTPS